MRPEAEGAGGAGHEDRGVEGGEGDAVERSRPGAAAEAVDRRGDHHGAHGERGPDRARLPRLRSLFRGDDEAARPSQQRADAGDDVHPEGGGREREGGERVAARAGERDGGERERVVGGEVEQELRGGGDGERLRAAEDPHDGERHVDREREAGEEVHRREQVLEADP